MITIQITQIRGCCRWCRCTDEEPCEGGCAWANREQTLCTACVPLDRAMKTNVGRRELAEFVQANGFLAAPPRPAKRRKRGSR